MPGMKVHRASSAVVLTLWASAILFGAASMQAPTPVVFRNATLIPVDSDRIAAAQTVVVRGPVIESVEPDASSRVSAGAMVIDGTGGFLVPGLTDMHVHLPGPTAPVGRADDELFWIPEGDIKRQLEQIRSRPGNYRLTN